MKKPWPRESPGRELGPVGSLTALSLWGLQRSGEEGRAGGPRGRCVGGGGAASSLREKKDHCAEIKEASSLLIEKWNYKK